ncbi:MAG: hypothetical protein Q8K92_19905 [Leadbetterella sp.]|nr:hypothetical protein [Leadbetterella sp.]
MTVEIYLKDSIRHYFLNMNRDGKVTKATVIGSAIINLLMSNPSEINSHYKYRRGNILDKEITKIHFHSKININDQQLVSIAHLIEKTFLKELRDFAEVYKKLTELSFKEIVIIFFKKHNIPTKCLYDEVFFESYLKLIRWRNAQASEIIQIKIN